MANRYEILRKLGQGGMGTVYLASLKGEAGFERLVALKKLSAEAVGNADMRALFEREIRLGARLSHPSIVQVFDAGISGGEPYLATEFVDGGDLEDVINALRTAGTRLPPEALAHIASQICQALGFMVQLTDDAGQRLIQAHRDVSPGNILVSRTGAVKLADFGVARLTTSSTSSAVVRGKWQYFAPEISSQDPDIRADLFALGIVIYQLASLTHPFEASTAQGFYERASTIDPPQPAGMPASLWAVTQRALAKDPAQRFQTPEEMGEALLARAGGPLLPPAVPATRDPQLSQPFARAADAPMTNPFEMDPDWHATGPEMGVDGRMSSPLPPLAPRPPLSQEQVTSPSSAVQSLAEAVRPDAAPAAVPRLADARELQLDDRPVDRAPREPDGPLHRSYRESAPRRSSVKPVLFGLVALAVAGAGYWAWKMLPRPTVLSTGGTDSPFVGIDSEPDGATVFSGKDQLGVTPLSFPNDYPRGTLVQLTLRKRGYRQADVAFVGSTPQHLRVKLEKLHSQ